MLNIPQSTEVFISRHWLRHPSCPNCPAYHLTSLTWYGAVVCAGNGENDMTAHNSTEQHTQACVCCCCSCRYHINAPGLWPFVFYSLATVNVYQQPATSSSNNNKWDEKRQLWVEGKRFVKSTFPLSFPRSFLFSLLFYFHIKRWKIST